VIYLVFADRFNWPKITARHNSDSTKHFGYKCDGWNKVCCCQYNAIKSIFRLNVMGWLCELHVLLLVDSVYEFIWPFDSAKMLQISKFSAILTPSLLLDFSVNTGPHPSTERSIFISITRRFWWYNAKLCSISINGVVSIRLSSKFEFY
jgi:hypothetical protein